MKVVNQTPFAIGYLAGRIGHPAHSLTVVVKGTFRLVAGSPAILAEEPLQLAGDDPDEEEGPRSLRYPLDLVPFKPKADFILVGKCHTGPRPLQRCKVAFTVGALTRERMVTGDRVWKADGGTSEPKPFTEMDLVYERSFGGAEWPANPVGRGLALQSPPEGPLPNVEDPRKPLVDASQRPGTAGFGPLRRNWKPRSDKVGTYDAAWRKERWPWVPADFDFAHFNAAPEDMQVPYLRGDERLRLENLHPTASVFESALPGLRVRCLVRPAAASGVATLNEVSMALDTLWMDAETQALVLVWRGVIPVASRDVEESVDQLFVSSEAVKEPPASRDALGSRLALALAPPEIALPEEPPEPANASKDDAREAADFDRVGAEADAKTRAVLADAGVDPDSLPKPTVAQVKAQAARLAELGFADDETPPEPRWTRERVAAAAAAGQSLAGRDLSELDLSELDLGGADLTETDLSDAKLCRSKAPKCKLDGAQLQRADLTDADLGGASFVEADLTEAKLERANLTEATLERALAEGAVFRECRLERAVLKRFNGRRADFTAAVCTEADFTGANLAESRLDRGDWRRAVLSSASLHAARGEGIDLRDADLTGIRASERAAFPRARFAGVKADRSNWREADLSGCDFSLGSFERADFSRARLDAAVLAGAQMKHAKFGRASLRAAKLMRANLFQADLERADLSAADLSGASLYGAETWEAVLDAAVLTGANLKGTKLAKESE